MTNTTPYTSKGKALLWAIVMGAAGALGYLLAELLMQHDLTWVFVSMIGIFVVLTAFSYFLNIRGARTKRTGAPRS